MPSPVDKYYKQIKEQNPSYSEEQAWATAWSVFCKYKNPGSDSCKKPTSEYLKGKKASPLDAFLAVRVASRFVTAGPVVPFTPPRSKAYLPQVDWSKEAFKFEPKEKKEHKVERIAKVIREATGLSKGMSEAIADAFVRGREVARLAIQKGWPLDGDIIEGPSGTLPLDALSLS